MKKPEFLRIIRENSADMTDEAARSILYGRATALIAAMAEVILSNGDRQGAVGYVTGYRDTYKRFSAFRACLADDLSNSALASLNMR